MKKKILLIDDKASIAKVVSIYLGKEYDFTYCENPIKAIEWLHEGNMPDLIISDIRMPEMDGIEATFRLRDKGVKTPIIAVTAFAFDQDRNRILEAGCDDYISKPIFSAILKERIRYWLNEKRKL